jgi:O-antigen ligase
MQFLYVPILISAMVVLAGLSLFFASRPLAGAVLVVATYLYETLVYSMPVISLGIQISPSDIVFAILFVAVTLRFALGMRKPRRREWIPICLFVLFFISLARGIALYGREAASESRGWFYFLSGVLYFSSFGASPRMRKKLTNILLTAGVALVGVAIYRWMALAAGFTIGAEWAVARENSRVLNASQANLLAMAFFASVFLNLSNVRSKWQCKAFYLFGPVLVVLQHRTVWAVMIAGLLLLGLQDARFRKKAIIAIIAMAIAGLVMTVFFFGHQSEVITASLQDSATNGDTFLWRVEGWYQLLFNNPARNTFNDTIGQPFGTGYERTFGDVHVPSNIVPHNYYIEAFLRFGLIGLLLLIFLYVLGMRRLKRLPRQLHKYAYPDVRFWRLVLFMQLAYFFTYGASYDQSILTGMAIAGFRLRLPRPTPSELAAPE